MIGDCPQALSNGGAGATATAGAAAGAAAVAAAAAAAAAAAGAAAAAAAADLVERKRRAWAACRGMRRRDAMVAFVALLDEVDTAWDARGGAQ